MFISHLSFIPCCIVSTTDSVVKYTIRKWILWRAVQNIKIRNQKPRVTRSTTELPLLSSEGLNNHNRGTTEDLDSKATDVETGSYIGDEKGEPFKEMISIRLDQNLPQGENWIKEDRRMQKAKEEKTRR
jgi:hypothetical protein